jgi:hypothetical protein
VLDVVVMGRQRVRTVNGSNGTNADERGVGPHLFNNSLAGLIVISDFSECVRIMVPMGHILTSATMTLTCSIIHLLA